MAKNRSTPFAGCTMAVSNVTPCEPLTQRASCCRATAHSALPLGDGRSVQLGAGQFHHLAPLLGLFHDELAKVGGRAHKRCAAQVSGGKADARPASNQHPASFKRQDCTLVTWYRCLYAPRTGGAYDSHHRTAGIAGCTRRRGGCVAARGARAAGGDAGDRISRRWFASDE